MRADGLQGSSQVTPTPTGEFLVSIKQIDYYTCQPVPGLDLCYSPFTGQEIRLAPVVRVFGSTPAGQTVCLHLHKILPYLYVRYNASPNTSSAEHNVYLRKLAHSIDAALHLCHQPNKGVERRSASTLKARFVHQCTLVRAKPFYGFHKSEEFFAKIYVYDPKDLSRVANVLLSGAVLGQTFQPFEAHVPYLLKFKTDYNLHGMEHVRLSKVCLRDPVPESELPFAAGMSEGSYPVWTRESAPQSWLCRDGGGLPPKEAHCDLEADAFGDHVLNPGSIPATSLQEADEDVKMVPSLAPIWAEEEQRSRNLDIPFPPRKSMSPARNKNLLHHRFRRKYSGLIQEAIQENLSQKREGAPAQDSQEWDASLRLTQAANEAKSLHDESQQVSRMSAEADQMRVSQSQLLTQEADNVLLDTLQWMQENKDAVELEDEIWEGRIHDDEEEMGGDLSEYVNSSQRECNDIVQSSVIAEEVDGVALTNPVQSNLVGFQEDYGDNIQTGGAPGKDRAAEEEACDFEPLNLVLTPDDNGDAGNDSDSEVDSDSEGRLGQNTAEETTNGLQLEKMSPCALQEQSGALYLFRPITSAPSYNDVKSSMGPLDLSDVVYSAPFFSDPKDVPNSGRPLLYAGMEFKVKSKAPVTLQGFSGNSKGGSKYIHHRDGSTRGSTSCSIHLLASKRLPPSSAEVDLWLSGLRYSSSKRVSASARDLKMDPNTGQLVEEEHGDLLSLETAARQSASLVVSPSSQLEARPASPKYDEQVTFQLPDSFNEQEGNAENIDSSTPKHVGDHRDPSAPSSRSQTKGEFRETKRRRGELPKSGSLRKGTSQITPPSPLKDGRNNTPSSQAGYRYKQLEEMESTNECPTVLSIEIFVETRETYLPDPKQDAVKAVALVYQKQRRRRSSEKSVLDLVVCDKGIPKGFLSSIKRRHALSEDTNYFVNGDETALIRMAAARIIEADPDIIVGYEIQSLSVGYLNDRLALLQPGESFLRLISRSPTIPSNSETLSDEYGQLHASGLHSAGRILLNLWRILRSELKLNIYTFHNCVHALTRRRVPHFTHAQLTAWFQEDFSKFRCFEHLILRAVLNLEMMVCLDLVGRTCELAKVYGIDFFSVITRGSQYRVESLLLRLAHTQNYILISPSKSQVANQSAMECLPLVMEPESRFYTSPVLVLDFQSLYPSMVMAYNLCYSTLVGHVEGSSVASSLGVLSKYEARSLFEGDVPSDELTVSPNGSLFSSANVRKGVLPRMLQEILDTRQMLKKSMKELKPHQKALYRLLNSRQFALKLLANVTYGYTAAGFSGRMPCAELADAIVQFGRVTMENAIKIVESNQKWQAKVVYGDTDSIFVHLPGRSREDAFRIGKEIAHEVTSMNPSPVFLKFEKVYHPCILVTKKRYVGYAYENLDQKKPVFDAKGIETIRRDSCPAVAKLLERSLRILFESADLSLVKRYLLKQWGKIFKSRVSIQDFVFAKEVRLGTYSAKASVVPPAAIVAAKAMALDPRAEPKYAERVPYVVVHGEPGARLVDMVVSPGTLITNSTSLRLHETYYIAKQIVPALERCFSLLGADVKGWFVQMPKPNRWQPIKRPMSALGLSGYSNDSLGYRNEAKNRLTIDHFYLSKHCAVCDEMTATDQTICDKCCSSPQVTALALQARTASLERSLSKLDSICFHCGGRDLSGSIACSSLDCGVYYLRQKTRHQHNASVVLMLSSNKLF